MSHLFEHDWYTQFTEEKSTTKMSKPKRIGTRDRDLHSDHIREAYAAGYLDDETLGSRLDQTTKAVFARDLENLVDDLPSYAELKGTTMMPKKTRKKFFGLGRLFREHRAWTAAAGLVIGLLIALTPVIVLNRMRLENFPPFTILIVFTMVIGLAAALASFIRLIVLGVTALDG